MTPAGPVRDREAFAFGKQFLEDRGFLVKVPDDLFNQQDFLAGHDQDRARQFTDMWQDPEVKAVMAVRGGYGCLRLLPLLDLPKLAANPKILAGFSDLTVLLNEFSQQTGLITYHAPMLNTLARSDEDARAAFLGMLTGNRKRIGHPRRPGNHPPRQGLRTLGGRQPDQPGAPDRHPA